MAATASSAGLKQQWRPSRGRGQSRDTTDPSVSSGSGVHPALRLEKASPPPSSSSSLSTMASSSSLPMAGSSSSGTPTFSANKLSGMKGSFIPYLPHDDAIAAGLGADQGGIDTVETQRVADLLNQELGRLLRMQHTEFWRAVTMESSIEVSLDSYLQFRRRWYDCPAAAGSKPLAGVIVGDQDLFRRVFMVLYRMSLSAENREQSTSDNLLADEHAEVNFQRRFFDIPKLLDICAIFGDNNQGLTMQLVKNVFAMNDGLFEDLANIMPVISTTVRTMQQRCLSTLNMQLPTKPLEMSSVARIRQELLEVLDYLNDAVISLLAFVDAYSEGALVLVIAGFYRDSDDQILFTLETMHDSLIPTVGRCFLHLQGQSADTQRESPVQTRSKRLRVYLIDLAWRLFCCSYLRDSSYADSQDSYVNYLLDTYISNPKVRGERFVQLLSQMVDKSSNSYTGETTYAGGLIRNIDRKYKLLERINQLRKKGLMSLDTVQYDYVEAIISAKNGVTSASLSNSGLVPIKQELSEADVLNESKISHIKDILPDYGAGFIAACLEAYDNNPEEVIQRILEGTLHPTLQSLDTTVEVKPDSRNTSLPAKDRGKGKIEEAPLQKSSNFADTETSSQKPRWQSDTHVLAQRRSSSLSASSPSVSEDRSTAFPKISDAEPVGDFKGRFVRKDKGEANVQALLDDRHADDVLRTVAYAAQYEDEYDDSFDDLGTSIADGVEETESLLDLARSKPFVAGQRFLSQDTRTSGETRSAGFDRGVGRSSSQDSKTSGGSRSAGLGRGGWASNNNSFNQEAKSTIVREAGVGDPQRKGQPPLGRGRGRGRRNEPRGQFYVKDGLNYSYKVAGAVAVASVDEAEKLKKVERETIHGLGEGGNVPMPGDQATQSSSHANSRPGRSDSSGRGGAQNRGRGAPRKEHGHHRKDRSMQKHFASLGGM